MDADDLIIAADNLIIAAATAALAAAAAVLEYATPLYGETSYHTSSPSEHTSVQESLNSNPDSTGRRTESGSVMTPAEVHAQAVSSAKRKLSGAENDGPASKKSKLSSSKDQRQNNVASTSDADNQDDPDCPVGTIWLAPGTVHQLLEDPVEWDIYSRYDRRVAVFWWDHVVTKANAAFEKASASAKEARRKEARKKNVRRKSAINKRFEVGENNGFDEEADKEGTSMLLSDCIQQHSWAGYVDWEKDVLQDPRSKSFLDNLREAKKSCAFPRVVAMKEEPAHDVPCFKVMVGELVVDGRNMVHRRGGERWLTDIKGWGEDLDMEEFVEALMEDLI